MYHFEEKTLKNLEIFERKKWVFFEKKITRKSNAPSSKLFFSSFWLKIFLFFGKDLEILNFFFFFENIYIHIYMNKVHQMLHGFLEFKKT